MSQFFLQFLFSEYIVQHILLNDQVLSMICGAFVLIFNFDLLNFILKQVESRNETILTLTINLKLV